MDTRRDHRHRITMAITAGTAIALAGACNDGSAAAIDTDNAELELRWDNTLRFTHGRRVERQNADLLANFQVDDGNRNFGRGTVGNRVDLLSEFDAVWRGSSGLRISAAAWVDPAYRKLDNTSVATSNHLQGGVQALGLSPYARRHYRGLSGEFLDAFAFTRVELGSTALSLKLGRHTVYWGESLMTPFHGISYAQMPVDAAKAAASPGVEMKEVFRPLNQLSGQWQLSDTLTLAGQYFLAWEPFRLPEGGTYLGAADLLHWGGESLLIPTAALALPSPPFAVTAPFQVAARGPDSRPRQRGDFGLAARWSPAWLDGTAALHYRRFADKLPQVHVLATPQPPAGPPPFTSAPVAFSYQLAYAKDIELLGLSLAKQIAGVSVGLELSMRHGMPLVSDKAIAIPPGTAAPTDGRSLGARGDTWHVVANAVGVVPKTPLWSTGSWGMELAASGWSGLGDPHGVFKGRAGYLHPDGSVPRDKVTRSNVVATLVFTPTWYQVVPGVDLSLPLVWSGGLSGNSAVSGGGNKGAGSWSAGLQAEIHKRHTVELRYVDYFGRYDTNPLHMGNAESGAEALLKDRGAIYLSLKTAF